MQLGAGCCLPGSSDHKMWSHGMPVSSYSLTSSTSKPLHSLAVHRRCSNWPQQADLSASTDRMVSSPHDSRSHGYFCLLASIHYIWETKLFKLKLLGVKKKCCTFYIISCKYESLLQSSNTIFMNWSFSQIHFCIRIHSCWYPKLW